MVHNLPSQYRKDPWILALAAALQAKLDRQGEETASLAVQMSLDTVTWNIAVEERRGSRLRPEPRWSSAGPR